MKHHVRSQEDWDLLVSEGRLKYSPDIHISGSVSVESYRTGLLDITVLDGGEVVASSGVSNYYFLQGGVLTLKWNGYNRASVVSQTTGGATVTLIDYPDGVELNSSLGNVGDFELVRWNTGSMPPSRGTAPSDGPAHYIWVGRSIIDNGGPVRTEYLQSWDILDALFPGDPHLWNAGKYLTRCGRKGGREKRGEDLRKALSYLERAIEKEERHAQ